MGGQIRRGWIWRFWGRPDVPSRGPQNPLKIGIWGPLDWKLGRPKNAKSYHDGSDPPFAALWFHDAKNRRGGRIRGWGPGRQLRGQSCWQAFRLQTHVSLELGPFREAPVRFVRRTVLLWEMSGIEIFERATHRGPIFLGKSRRREWKFRARLKISIKIENFEWDWIFWSLGSLGLGVC